MDYNTKALELHEKYKGKLEINSRVPLRTRDDLSIYYTPGVAEPCRYIERNPSDAYKYTSKGNTVAVITDGSAVLGLGNIGSLAGLPVMEGKCVLFKEFGGVDAVPVCLATQDTDEIIATIKNIAPTYGGINLEDISAPRCFDIEKALIDSLDIPVFHDDQHGTAIVCLAGLINALKITGRDKETAKVVISGAGAAGIAVGKLLLDYGFTNIVFQDSKGLIYEGRDGLNSHKEEMAKRTNRDMLKGGLDVAIKNADIFIGVSKPDILTKEMVESMNPDSIIFAMSNPNPEINPDEAKSGGALIIATGRSDYPNQINNVLAFPGIFKGVFAARARKITTAMKLAAAQALADMVAEPTPERIIPGVFEEGVCDVVAEAVMENV